MRRCATKRCAPEIAGIARPFLLFVGRLIPEKGINELVPWYLEWRDKWSRDVDIVLVGSGPCADVLDDTDGRLHVFERVSEEEKQLLFKTCLATVNLSLFESFSYIIMESWIAGRPVIVNEDCLVTTDHVKTCWGWLLRLGRKRILKCR